MNRPRSSLDAVVVGRAGADLYPTRTRTPLHQQESFTRFVGGCGANIAVGLARLGVSNALVTAVGDDGHGTFLIDRLAREGIDVRHVARRAALLTPLTFCELWPPDRFPVTMYRCEHSPDWTIELDPPAVAELSQTALLVVTGSALAREPSRATTGALVRAAAGTVLLDLDWRPMLWADAGAYARELLAAVVPGTIAVGNEEEVALAGSVDAFFDAGARAFVVKRGPEGARLVTPSATIDVPPVVVEVCNGLGAGDAFAAAFGAALVHDATLEEAVWDGAAAGAIVASRLACAEAMPTAAELRMARRTAAR